MILSTPPSELLAEYWLRAWGGQFPFCEVTPHWIGTQLEAALESRELLDFARWIWVLGNSAASWSDSVSRSTLYRERRRVVELLARHIRQNLSGALTPEAVAQARQSLRQARRRGAYAA